MLYSGVRDAFLLPGSDCYLKKFFNRLLFWNTFMFIANWAESTENARILPTPQTHTASPLEGTFVTVSEPTVTCHYHPDSIVYFRVLSPPVSEAHHQQRLMIVLT